MSNEHKIRELELENENLKKLLEDVYAGWLTIPREMRLRILDALVVKRDG